MEHVLRQSLIALRLAERVGVDEQGRVAVYYTALLTNVGCHSDAHEQAKWFGDDIGLKADKYVYGLHGAQGALATARRFGSGADESRTGSGSALEFAVSGHRDLDAMITHHSEMARRLGEDLGLTPDTLDRPRRVVRAVGRQRLAGRAARRRRADRGPAGAHRRVRRGGPPRRRGRGRAGPAASGARQGVRPRPRRRVRGGRRPAAGRARHGRCLGRRHRVRARAGRGAHRRDRFDEALLAIADFVDLKSPYSLGHARAVADLAAEAAARLGLSEGEVRTLRRAGLVHCFGKLGVSNAILDKQGTADGG